MTIYVNNKPRDLLAGDISRPKTLLPMRNPNINFLGCVPDVIQVSTIVDSYVTESVPAM